MPNWHAEPKRLGKDERRRLRDRFLDACLDGLPL